MNKLYSESNAGIPLEWDDMRFEQAAVREAFYGILSGFGILPSESFIISGCTNDGVNSTDGYISLNGEVLKHVGTALPALPGGQVRYWSVEETNDPAGAEGAENGTVVQCYKIRRAVVVSGVAPADYMPLAAKTLANKINEIVGVKDDWTVYPIVAADVTAYDGTNTIIAATLGTMKEFRYKKNGKTLHFQLSLDLSTPTDAKSIAINLAGKFVSEGSFHFSALFQGRLYAGGTGDPAALHCYANISDGSSSIGFYPYVTAGSGTKSYNLSLNGSICIE